MSMKYDITKTQWYRDLVEECNKEPDKIHSVFIESGVLSKEEFNHLLNDFINQLDLVPKNAKIFTNLDGDIIDITVYRQPKISEEEKANFMKQMEKRFKKIELQDPTPEQLEALDVSMKNLYLELTKYDKDIDDPRYEDTLKELFEQYQKSIELISSAKSDIYETYCFKYSNIEQIENLLTNEGLIEKPKAK